MNAVVEAELAALCKAHACEGLTASGIEYSCDFIRGGIR